VGEKEIAMPTIKSGRKEIRVVLDDEGEIHTTLLEWAKKRRLAPGKAIGCILADWSDAINGKPNPFAIAIASAAGVNIQTGPSQVLQTTAEELEVSPEEKARQAALLEAAEQFM
jgi:hypothetical protein